MGFVAFFDFSLLKGNFVFFRLYAVRVYFGFFRCYMAVIFGCFGVFLSLQASFYAPLPG